MPRANDREHFQDYREQTQIKHSILAAYLPAYYHILKGSNDNLVYIDGFAGPGCYQQAASEKVFDGSPILALQLIASRDDFSKKVSTIFIESDPILFAQLAGRVENFHKEHPQIRKPIYRQGTFSEVVTRILNQRRGKLPPTFLFVDPCGVAGNSFETVRSVMENDKCEAFIFFNIDGVRRILGLKELSPVLVDLLGSPDRANALYAELNAARDPSKREEIILAAYCKALSEDMGVTYIIPFRVEHEGQRKASHYLIHGTKHPLGFSIMKDVMWRRGRGEDLPGALELRQKGRTNFIPMFDTHGETKLQILNALERGPVRASVFYKQWTMRSSDMLCEAAYRQILLELEAEGKIEVLDKDGRLVLGVDARPTRNNKPTLAKDYYIRRNQRSG